MYLMELPLDFFRHMGVVIANYRVLETISCTCKSLEYIARNVRELEFKPATSGVPYKMCHGMHKNGNRSFYKYRYGGYVGHYTLAPEGKYAEMRLFHSKYYIQVIYDRSAFASFDMHIGNDVVIKATPTKIKVKMPRKMDKSDVLAIESMKTAEEFLAIIESAPAVDGVREMFDRINFMLIQKSVIA